MAQLEKHLRICFKIQHDYLILHRSNVRDLLFFSFKDYSGNKEILVGHIIILFIDQNNKWYCPIWGECDVVIIIISSISNTK